MKQEVLYLIYMLGPILPILLWAPVALVITVWITKRLLRVRGRVLFGFVIFLVLLLLPLADFIVGRIYFYHLCDTQYGFKVYQTVGLPEQYWDEDGEPLFINYPPNSNTKVNGTLNFKMLSDYEVRRTGWRQYSKIFDIKRSKYSYYKKSTNEILAENTFFSHGCGWLRNKFTTSCSVQCDSYGQPNTKQKILSIFVPANANQ